MSNKLYYGDCLTIMREFIPPDSIDLVYLDPPFNSNRAYNAIYKDETGRPLPDQIEAFCDLWNLDAERERAIRAMPLRIQEAGIGNGLAEFWRIWPDALRKTQPRLLAYISYMTERLLVMRGLLKSSGCIYLHCDPTASHYIKVMLDGIFGHENFRNEIIWHYDGPQRPSKRNFASKHDILIRYSKSEQYFSDPEEIAPFRALGRKELATYRQLADGRHYYTTPKGDYSDASIEKLREQDRIETTKNGTVRVRHFLPTDSDGNIGRKKQLHDVWNDIPSVGHAGGRERLGYATQKPLALLQRIIKASSRPGDLVFDPFCGCATTLEAAHRLGRRWIGIDIAIHAIKRVAKVRLEDRLGLKEGKDFTIDGVPRSMQGAQELWRQDPYHFQKWAVEQVDGFVTSRRSGDGGIDGRLYFDLGGKRLESMVLEVKGGANVGVSVLRDLRAGVARQCAPRGGCGGMPPPEKSSMEREGALMAGLILLEAPGARRAANFRKEMAAAGDLEHLGKTYPKMQMLTIQEILDGKRFATPSVARGRGEGEPSLPMG